MKKIVVIVMLCIFLGFAGAVSADVWIPGTLLEVSVNPNNTGLTVVLDRSDTSGQVVFGVAESYKNTFLASALTAISGGMSVEILYNGTSSTSAIRLK